MRCLLLLVVFVVMSGCTQGGIVLPPEYLSEDIAETGQHFTGAVADASTAKELAKFRTDREQYEDYAEAYKSSGFTMQYQTLKIGEETVVLPVISFKQPPIAPQPVEVSEHPVWKTANNILGTATRWGFGYLAVDSVVGAYKSIADNAGDKFYGDTQMVGSYNTAGNDQNIEVGRVGQDNSTRDNSDGCTNGDCGGDPEEEETLATNCSQADGYYVDSAGYVWVNGETASCSCNSWIAGHCADSGGNFYEAE